MGKGVVFDIQRFSLHDGPGVRTILFLKGCPLQCKWCCNLESQSPQPEIMYTEANCIACGNCVSVCPTDALSLTSEGIKVDYSSCSQCGRCTEVCNTGALEMSGKEYTIDDVIPELVRDRSYYQVSGGGVTISGGEPLLQDDFTAELLVKLKESGIHTAIETAGAVDWESFEKVMEDTDLFLYDLKHLQDFKHKEGTGKGNKLVVDNLKRLINAGKRVIIRFPLIPDFNIDENHILQLARFLNKMGIETLHILPYHRLGISKYDKLGKKYELSHLDPPSDKKVKEIETILRKNTDLKVVLEG